MNHLVVQRVQLLAHAELLRVDVVDLPLHVQHVHNRVRIEHHLEQRVEEPAHQADEAAMRFVERGVLEGVVRRLGARAPRPLELLHEIRSHALRIQKPLQLDVGQLLDLLLGVVHAALLFNPRPNLAHDLLDVDGVGADVEFSHKKDSRLRTQGSGAHACHARRLPFIPYPLPLLKLLPNSGASFRHVPRMPIERMSAFMPVR